MALFHHRPLAAACTILILLAALALSFVYFGTAILFVAVAVLFLFSLVLWLFKRTSYCRFLAFLLTLGALLGVGRVMAERTYIERLLGKQINTQIVAIFTVEEIGYRNGYGSEFLVMVRELNGEPCRAKAIVLTEDLAPFGIGDSFGGNFYCLSVSDNSLDSEDSTAYRSDGVSVVLKPLDDDSLSLVKSGNGSFKSWLYDLRRLLYYGITNAVEDEAGELLGALLIGTREGLDSRTVRDFRRVGLSHLLAISGLHLAILTGILDWFFRRLRASKHLRIVLVSLFCLGYLFLTGFSFSVLRSVLMLLILYFAFGVGGDYDAFTALCFGGALMVLWTPGAVLDLSFQMTMLATFGILAFGELQTEILRLIPVRRGILGFFLGKVRAVISSLMVTLFATVAILPIQWLTFGEMSLLSPLSNLPMLLLTAPLLGLGLILLLLTAMGLPASFIALPCRLLAEGMLWITQKLSPAECMLSLRYDFVPFLFIPFLVITAILLILRLGKRLRYLVFAPVALVILAFAICLGVSHSVGDDQITVTYRTTGTNEGLLLMQNERTVICDFSNGSYTQLYEDYTVLREQGAVEVDVLMLTHYHDRHAVSLASFCDAVLVRTLWLPEPQDEDDLEILDQLLAVALARDITVTVYTYGTACTVFEQGTLQISKPLTDARSVEPALRIDLAFDETSIRYESAAYSEYAREQAPVCEDKVISHLILGGHGPKPHAEILPQNAVGLQEVWLANDDVVLYCSVDPKLRYVINPRVRGLTLE